MKVVDRPAAPIARTTNEWRAALDEKAKVKTPTFFPMRAQLPKAGRTNQVLGASSHMNVVLKTYASGGENELHAHTNEDHVFVILQGGAVFHGPRGETREVGKNDCVLVPCGALYSFTATEGEPLVLLRVGAIIDVAKDVMDRIDREGAPIDGFSERNKEVPVVLHEGRWFE
jgi:mannose-6-phosphate isomerase-like protein (cupin superfamily)